MNRYAILTCIVFILISSAGVNADDSLYLTLYVSELMDINDYDLFISGEIFNENDYDTLLNTDIMNLEIVGEENDVLYSLDFTPDFLLLSDPPVILNETVVGLILPYNEGMKYIKIHHNDTEKLYLNIQDSLCNNNGTCDEYENFYSCPDDCPENSEDGICTSVSSDGVCDPDCHPSIDLDCSCPNDICDEWENHKSCREDCSSGGNDGYCDGVKDDVCDPDCFRDEDVDCTCPDSVCQAFESPENCPEDCVSAGYGLSHGYWVIIVGIVLASLLVLFIVKRKHDAGSLGA